MKVVNLTGHELRMTDNRNIVKIPSTGRARVISKSTKVGEVMLDGLTEALPITQLCEQEIYGLPEPADDTLYVVSGIVASHARRPDVVAPGRTLRDGKGGRVLGCMGFVQPLTSTNE